MVWNLLRLERNRVAEIQKCREANFFLLSGDARRMFTFVSILRCLFEGQHGEDRPKPLNLWSQKPKGEFGMIRGKRERIKRRKEVCYLELIMKIPSLYWFQIVFLSSQSKDVFVLDSIGNSQRKRPTPSLLWTSFNSITNQWTQTNAWKRLE